MPRAWPRSPRTAVTTTALSGTTSVGSEACSAPSASTAAARTPGSGCSSCASTCAMRAGCRAAGSAPRTPSVAMRTW